MDDHHHHHSQHKPKRTKSREISSRFLSSSPSHPLSPARRNPTSFSPLPETRKPSNLWPSSTPSITTTTTTPSIKTPETLADHLGIDRRKDRKDSNTKPALVKTRNRRESASLFDDDNDRHNAKENHRPAIGGSARYTFSSGKSPSSTSTFSSSSSACSNKLTDSEVIPRRVSVDGRNVSGRRSYDNFADIILDSGSEISDAGSGGNHHVNVDSPSFGAQSSSRKLGMEVPSKYMSDTKSRQNLRRWTSDSNLRTPPVSEESSPKMNKFTLKIVMKRANSLTGSKSGTTQWAMSPGRSAVSTESLGTSTKSSFSSLKPTNCPDSKSKGVEKLLHMGLDLFKGRKSSSSNKSLARSNSGYTVTDTAHQLRCLHSGLMQWRYANARAEMVDGNVAAETEGNCLGAFDNLMRLRQSVLHKKLKLQKERLAMKLNLILHSQLKSLEDWGEMERQHMAAVSMMKECLYAVVCRLPLVNGAKVDSEIVAIHLRKASDYSASIKMILDTFSPSAEQTRVLLSELAGVVAQEKLLSEECLELCMTISALEMEERSLVSSIIQLESYQQEQLQLQQHQR